MASRVSTNGGRLVAAQLASAFLAAILLSSAPLQADVQATKAFELVHWHPESPQFKGKENCLVTGEAVKCIGTFAVGSVTGGGNFTGTVRGDTWTGRSDHRGQDSSPNCQYLYEGSSSAVITLKADGTIETTTTDRTDTFSSVSGPCAPFMPKTSNSSGPIVTVGTWRQIAAGTESAVTFRNLLFAALGFGGDAARSCLDEVMNTAEAAAAKDPKMADDLARLRKAAAGAHAIEVLAAVPVGPTHFDDFDPKWWDALKEVVPNPASTPDPQDTATDRVIDLLPPPINVLVNIVRTGSKTMRAIKTHIADPTVHREVYACYRRKREGSGGTPIAENIGQDALESEAAQILHDAIGAGCKAPNSFKNSYEAQLKGFASKEAREKEFTRLLRPLAVRFEFIYRVEDAKARRETLIAARWAPVQDILARLKARVNACIADRASRSR